MTVAPKFEVNERVLCFHGPLIYEAKVLKSEVRNGKPKEEDNGPHYFIHYKGWKQTWDEWVPESRVLKFNDENLKKQSDLTEALQSKKSKVTKAAETSGGDKATSKKRAREAEREEEFLKRPEIKIAIPESLKIQLVDDWENVTKNQKLVSLPRDPCVSEILRQFRASLQKNSSGKESRMEDLVQEIVDGLKVYFDRALGNLLLYRFERQQYVELKKKSPEKAMSDVYGAEHLLRLFVQLPQLIAHTNMDADSVTICRDYFVEFLKFMEANSEKFFLAGYENASPAYVQQSSL